MEFDLLFIYSKPGEGRKSTGFYLPRLVRAEKKGL